MTTNVEWTLSLTSEVPQEPESLPVQPPKTNVTVGRKVVVHTNNPLLDLLPNQGKQIRQIGPKYSEEQVRMLIASLQRARL